jgi:hypothetical protein
VRATNPRNILNPQAAFQSLLMDFHSNPRAVFQSLLMDFLNLRAVFPNLPVVFLSPVKTWVDSLQECNLRVAGF